MPSRAEMLFAQDLPDGYILIVCEACGGYNVTTHSDKNVECQWCDTTLFYPEGVDW